MKCKTLGNLTRCSTGVLSRFLWCVCLSCHGGWPYWNEFSCKTLSQFSMFRCLFVTIFHRSHLASIVGDVFLNFPVNFTTISTIKSNFCDFSSQRGEFASAWNNDRSRKNEKFSIAWSNRSLSVAIVLAAYVWVLFVWFGDRLTIWGELDRYKIFKKYKQSFWAINSFLELYHSLHPLFVVKK
jgi:hypothetical protein